MDGRAIGRCRYLSGYLSKSLYDDWRNGIRTVRKYQADTGRVLEEAHFKRNDVTLSRRNPCWTDPMDWSPDNSVSHPSLFGFFSLSFLTASFIVLCHQMLY